MANRSIRKNLEKKGSETMNQGAIAEQRREVSPASDVYRDRTAKIGENVRIGRFVSIHSGVIIGDNVVIEDGSRVYDNCEIESNSVVGPNAVLRPYTKIGHHTIFGTLSCCEGHSAIGNFTTVHAQCHITQKVTIGNDVFIAPFFIATNTPAITTGRHGTAKTAKPELLPTVIEDGVRIAASVRMTPGHKIGAFSLIEQDTFITKDIPPHSRVRAGKDKIGQVVGK